MTVDYTPTPSGFLVKSGSDTQLRERIAELEFAQEDREWIALGSNGDTFEFSRSFVSTITRLARLMFIKNPLISRGVKIKADYVFGRSVNIQAKHDMINEVLKTFLDDKHNQTEFTAQAARLQKETELQTDGNIFFVLVPHQKTGHIRIHSIPADEIVDIITDPTNRKATWFYKRVWRECVTDLATGETKDTLKTIYYRDWRCKPPEDRKTIGRDQIVDNAYIYHIRVGGFSDWKFGVSEIYAPLDWAKAYKKFLENWSTIVDAYARFAFKVTTTGGKSGVAAAKAKLATTINTTTGERNPAPVAGSSIIMHEGNDLTPVRTSGATTSADDGRRLLLMVAAGVGLPETFFGDVSVGSLATATSLDRPTELMLTNRQTLWTDIIHDILDFVIYYAVKAIDGPLRTIADIEMNEYDEEYVIFDDTIDDHIDVDFPPITEHSLIDSITAIVQGAPFISDPILLARLVLTVLGQNDIDTIIERLYPDGVVPSPAPTQGGPNADPQIDPNVVVDPATQALTQAADDMRAAIEALRAALTNNATDDDRLEVAEYKLMRTLVR